MADKLTPEQKMRLRKLNNSIVEDKLTVGYSIESRGQDGFKRWCMVTRTVELRDCSPNDSRIVSCLLGKRVTSEVLRDAVVRGALSAGEAKAELKAAIQKYDADIARFMGVEDGSEES